MNGHLQSITADGARRQAHSPALLMLVLTLTLGSMSACADVTTAGSEELTDPGPRDASFNGALSFDGVDDYASVGTARSPQVMRDQSLLLWFRGVSTDSGAGSVADDDFQILFALRRSDWSGIVLALDRDVPLAYNVFGPRDLARASNPLARGAWHHLAYVADFATSLLYIDGVQVATGPEPATNRTPTQAFIGSLDGYSNMFHGAIDELRVYDRAFSADEVAAIAKGARPDDDVEPLVIYLPFDEAQGARSYDRSGLGNHAELGDGVPALMPARIVADLP